jgi:hypothetical protein
VIQFSRRFTCFELYDWLYGRCKLSASHILTIMQRLLIPVPGLQTTNKLYVTALQNQILPVHVVASLSSN